MNIAETIYQHVKTMPMAKAIEVLHFVEFLETKPDFIARNSAENNLHKFMKNFLIRLIVKHAAPDNAPSVEIPVTLAGKQFNLRFGGIHRFDLKTVPEI
jgi:hypothetical protein